MIEALRRWLGRPRQPVIRSRQLLDWLEEASQGFLVLDRATRLQHLNGRARRLLGIGTEQVVRAVICWKWCAATSWKNRCARRAPAMGASG